MFAQHVPEKTAREQAWTFLNQQARKSLAGKKRSFREPSLQLANNQQEI